MKAITLIFLSFITNAALGADCYDEISLHGTHSSRIFYLAPKEVEEYAILDAAHAGLVIDILLQRETSCRLKEIALPDAVNCYTFPRSGVTCEVATDIGHFIVHRSAYGSFDHSIIYTRWD